MKKTWTLALLLFTALLVTVLVGCGGGGGGGYDPIPPVGNTCTVKGVVYAPNGTDPVSGASVYVPAKSNESMNREEVYALKGKAPQDAITSTTSGSDGSFTLEKVPVGDVKIIIEKGLFKKTIEKNLTGDTELAQNDTTFEVGPDKSPTMAVITGYYDNMEDLLAKIGFGTVDASGHLVVGTEKFTLINGKYGSTDMSALLKYPAEMAKYDIIFFNCGCDNVLADNPDAQQNLRDFVANGGRIYVTDLARVYVDKVFDNDQYIKFVGDVGEAGITSKSDVLVPSLLAWLKNYSGVIDENNKITIVGFAGGWAVVDTFNAANVTSWIKGPVRYSSIDAVKDLTFTFDYGDKGGKVLYSSYHTIHDSPSVNISAQERVLQYLVFEMAQ